jgi:hypothetical protein
MLDVYLYIVVFPPVRGFPAYLHTSTCIYMWPLTPTEYNLSIPHMVSEPVLGLPYPPVLCLWPPPPARPGHRRFPFWPLSLLVTVIRHQDSFCSSPEHPQRSRSASSGRLIRPRSSPPRSRSNLPPALDRPPVSCPCFPFPIGHRSPARSHSRSASSRSRSAARLLPVPDRPPASCPFLSLLLLLDRPPVCAPVPVAAAVAGSAAACLFPWIGQDPVVP